MQAYYEDGTLMEKYSYIDNTLYLTGAFRLYFPNGELKEERFYKDCNDIVNTNTPEVVWRIWSEDGSLLDETNYNQNIEIRN